MALIVSQLNRPVPEWVISSVSTGTAAEPARINWPSSPRWSILQSEMASPQFSNQSRHHSSINRGTAPFNRRLGFSSDMVIFCSFSFLSSIYKTLAENCSAVVVLPHHLGPSIKTAPFPSSFSLQYFISKLFSYIFFTQDASSPLILPLYYALNHSKSNVFPMIGEIFFRRLA